MREKSAIEMADVAKEVERKFIPLYERSEKAPFEVDSLVKRLMYQDVDLDRNINQDCGENGRNFLMRQIWQS